jgi:hypothetical protein
MMGLFFWFLPSALLFSFVCLFYYARYTRYLKQCQLLSQHFPGRFGSSAAFRRTLAQFPPDEPPELEFVFIAGMGLLSLLLSTVRIYPFNLSIFIFLLIFGCLMIPWMVKIAAEKKSQVEQIVQALGEGDYLLAKEISVQELPRRTMAERKVLLFAIERQSGHSDLAWEWALDLAHHFAIQAAGYGFWQRSSLNEFIPILLEYLLFHHQIEAASKFLLEDSDSLNLSPQSKSLYLAQLYLREGGQGQAAKHLLDQIGRAFAKPDRTEVPLLKAWALYQLGQVTEAEALLQTYWQTLPKNLQQEAFRSYYSGLATLASPEPERARAYFEQAVVLGKGGLYAGLAKQELEKLGAK